MNRVFTIDVEMEERWIPYFLSMLKRMEYNGSIGHSEYVSIFSDGDGDFRPKFKTDIKYEVKKPVFRDRMVYSPFVYDAR